MTDNDDSLAKIINTKIWVENAQNGYVFVPSGPFYHDLASSMMFCRNCENIFGLIDKNQTSDNYDEEEIRRETQRMQSKMIEREKQNNRDEVKNAWMEMNIRAKCGTFPWLTEYNEKVHWSNYADGYDQSSGYAKQLLADHPDNPYIYNCKGNIDCYSPNSPIIQGKTGFPGNVPVLVTNGDPVQKVIESIVNGNDNGYWKPINSLQSGDVIVSWRKKNPCGYVASEIEQLVSFQVTSPVYDINFDKLPFNVTQSDILQITSGQLLWTHHGWMNLGSMADIVNQGYSRKNPTIIPLLGLWGTPIRLISRNPHTNSRNHTVYNIVIKNNGKESNVDTFCVPYGIARSYCLKSMIGKLKKFLF